MTTGNVKGALFLDYVRMLRARKDVDWSVHLDDLDRGWLTTSIDPTEWYPMESFERLGNAILFVVAQGSMELVRMWGQHTCELLCASQPMLLAPHNPVETLNRFRVLRATWFDFEALQVPMLLDDEAELVIRYGMGMPAEEAATWQAVGFFERLLEKAGATDLVATLTSKSWEGAPHTKLTLRWT